MVKRLAQAALDRGIELQPEALAAFERYLALLLDANQRFNLTAMRDAEGIERRHFLESLTLGQRLEQAGLLLDEPRLLDLGSGAGVPGLPLKFAWPRLRLTLLEATAKKSRFIRSVIDELQLDSCAVETGRAETLAHRPDLRTAFDLVTARAVASLPVLVELALPFLRLGGTLVAVKGSRTPEEVEASGPALRACGGRLTAVEPLRAGDSMVLVLVKKHAPTPAAYPRAPGRPAAQPLA